MNEYVNFLLFGIYPYLAIAIFVIVSIFRFNKDQYNWRSGSSQLLRKRQFMWGSNLFHVGILIIFVGHFFGLLVPVGIYDAVGVSHTFKQLMAMIVGGIAGVMCFAGLVLLTHRRLFDSRIRSNSSLSDILILLLLLVQVTIGLFTILISAQHLDGEEMVRFMTWAQMIATLQGGASDLVMEAHWLFKLHIFLGLTIFLVFPFTRLIHVFSAPIWYLGRQGYQVVRSRSDSGSTAR